MWNKEFIKDIKTKYEISQIEFNKYKSTGNIIYLQQACEKLFSVVENYLMVKYNYRSKNYGDLRSRIRNNFYDSALLRRAFQLHKFFYNGEVQMPKYDAEEEFIYLSSLMKQRIKKL